MGSVNKAILVGNLGRDAELTMTSGGVPIARFSVATTSRTKNSQTGAWEDRTDWHRVVLFGRQAESLRDYLKKGTLVGIDGRIQTRSFEDRDGNKRSVTEVVADRVELIGGRSGGGGRAAVGRQAEPDDEPSVGREEAADTDDDIPF